VSVIEVDGLRRLKGEIRIQGSKNTVLPVMAASLLHKGTTVIKHVPAIQDVLCMLGILQSLGCHVSFEDHVLTIDAKDLTGIRVPDEESRKMRSSILLLGPLLAREGMAELCYPGGCSIGARPVDLHLKALQEMGARIRSDGERIHAKTAGLRAGSIKLPYPSVGATENILMAASLAEGRTCLRGAAREPEIVALCEFLAAMGVTIHGAGTDIITVEGGKQLRDTDYTIPGDRIVAGTYLGAVLAAGGEIFLRDARASELHAALDAACEMGAQIRADEAGIAVSRREMLQPVTIGTGPYPQFPTDLQPVMMAVACFACGRSQITENVFEARFAIVKELQKMGAHIIIDGRRAFVDGTGCLHGAALQAKDLRGGAALTVAALAAQGESVISGYPYISRGYEDICADLQQAGARIRLK
jgi:UDP-N-acetylglucosamine 1-carboxyvinyltransferase